MKILPVVICTVFFQPWLCAQKVTIGLHSGYGKAAHERIFEKKYRQSYFNMKPVNSYAYGIDFILHFKKHYSIVSGTNIEAKGVERYNMYNRYYYFSIPLSFRFNLLNPERKKCSPYIQAGVYGSKLLRHDQKPIGRGQAVDIYLPEFQTPMAYDFGWNAAIGAQFRVIRHVTASLDFCFSHGLRDLYHEGWREWPKLRAANVTALVNYHVQYTF